MFKPKNFTDLGMNEEEKNLLEDKDQFEQFEESLAVEKKPAIEPENIQETTLNNDVTIEGNIISHGKLNLYGDLNGNLTCDYDLVVSGTINGNVICGSLVMNQATINGDIEVANSFSCSSNSFINGNINSNECTIDGFIKGQINCAGNVHIQKNSNIIADITCGSISILQGASIEGKVVVKGGN